MTLLDLLKTCNHEYAVRIHLGSEGKYFDINSKDKATFTKWLEWTGIYDSVDNYYNGDVESWNVQQITFTKYDSKGKRYDEQYPVLFIKMK
jgi:hypothetical protein